MASPCPQAVETYAKQTQTDVVQQDRVSESEGEEEEEAAPPSGTQRPELDRSDPFDGAL